LLHGVLAAWLLSLRMSMPPPAITIETPIWLPEAAPAPPPPVLEPLLFPTEPIEPAPFLVPEAEALPPPREYDWFGDARGVAGELGRKSGAGSSPFAPPEKPERKLKSSPDGPPPLFEKPLPRVGTTVRTPEGETILWVSDYCYISLGSTSLTMQDFHKAREGVRRCIIPLGKREPRGDLFDHLKK
jgi:hypothetical protein